MLRVCHRIELGTVFCYMFIKDRGAIVMTLSLPHFKVISTILRFIIKIFGGIVRIIPFVRLFVLMIEVASWSCWYRKVAFVSRQQISNYRRHFYHSLSHVRSID